MKLIDLIESIEKSHTEIVHWRNYIGGNGYWGVFKLDDKTFVIELEIEDFESLKERCDLQKEYGVDENILKDKRIIRLDYYQIVNNERQYGNTDNMGNLALKVLSTVAHEAAAKLKNEKVNIIYFAAKSSQTEGSENKRKTIYPRAGKMMADKLNMFCLVNRTSESVTTFLIKGFSTDEIVDLKSRMS